MSRQSGPRDYVTEAGRRLSRVDGPLQVLSSPKPAPGPEPEIEAGP